MIFYKIIIYKCTCESELEVETLEGGEEPQDADSDEAEHVGGFLNTPGGVDTP